MLENLSANKHEMAGLSLKRSQVLANNPPTIQLFNWANMKLASCIRKSFVLNSLRMLAVLSYAMEKSTNLIGRTGCLQQVENKGTHVGRWNMCVPLFFN